MQEIDLCDTVEIMLYKRLKKTKEVFLLSRQNPRSIDDLITIHRTRLLPKVKVSCDCSQIAGKIPDSNNIAHRAALLFLHEARESPLFDNITLITIHIKKQIPLMAGLGGSSTNAATVLKGLNEICHDFFSQDQLIQMGVQLGADVPFGIVGGHALCEGIGEKITPLPDLPPTFYVIVQPNFVCDTKTAFSLYDKIGKPNKGITKVGCAELFMPYVEKPVNCEFYANEFQALYADERIENLCYKLQDLGADIASLTGSGSAVFGTFTCEKLAKAAVTKLEKSGEYPFVCLARNHNSAKLP